MAQLEKKEKMQTVNTMPDTSHQRQTFKPKLNTVFAVPGSKKRMSRREKILTAETLPLKLKIQT